MSSAFQQNRNVTKVEKISRNLCLNSLGPIEKSTACGMHSPKYDFSEWLNKYRFKILRLIIAPFREMPIIGGDFYIPPIFIKDINTDMNDFDT